MKGLKMMCLTQLRYSHRMAKWQAGIARGIHPRWGKVIAKGHENTDDYEVGDWILVEHGRWTRGITLENSKGKVVVRAVEAESVLGTSKEKPTDAITRKTDSNQTALAE